MEEKKLSDDSFFTFQLGKGNFALPVEYVREVLNYEPITRVPKSLPYLKGVMNIRGAVVTVLDLRELFGFNKAVPQEKSSLIVLEIPQECETQPLTIGMFADTVDIVTRLEMVPSENYDFGTLPGREDFIKGIARKNDEFVMILDVEKIIHSIEEEIEK